MGVSALTVIAVVVVLMFFVGTGVVVKWSESKGMSVVVVGPLYDLWNSFLTLVVIPGLFCLNNRAITRKMWARLKAHCQ